ncbi:hypothetical protein [Salidesulfovibrio onnuriiensis]|uniref:hypothetical protein n=1 Tax=Salidesulfovibrio onnuriiensis TaxID=2583823 RepID=UPI0011CB5A43|nr:hypothetical protein [Salidesulfovibrio onnuriiensis]
MGFFSKLVPPSGKGERNFDRGMRAELRRDFAEAEQYFSAGADNFAEHLALKDAKGQEPLVRHLVMGGICCTRIGRNREALAWLDRALALRDDVPDAWLNAGYAAAKLGDADRAAGYWSRYPQWSEERIVAEALKQAVRQLKTAEQPDLQAACEAVAQASFSQMRHNHALPPERRDAILKKKGY